jgi:hypothetical protein
MIILTNILVYFSHFYIRNSSAAQNQFSGYTLEKAAYI